MTKAASERICKVPSREAHQVADIKSESLAGFATENRADFVSECLADFIGIRKVTAHPPCVVLGVALVVCGWIVCGKKVLARRLRA